MIEISDVVDVHAVVGAAVVFTIIGAAVFGVYYIGFARPAAAELEQVKTEAASSISQTLGSVGTEQALSALSSFSAQIQAASSKSEVSAIQAEAATVYQRELKRKSLLDTVTTTVTGVYRSTADVAAFTTLATTLRGEINAKTTLTELQDYELSGTIDTQATSTWRSYFTGLIQSMREDVVMKRCNSSTYWEAMSRDNALALVGSSTWSTLRKMDFENTVYVEVPVTDTFSRTPTIRANSVVNIYVYDSTTENMVSLYGNATVRSVIYSTTDLATISWTLTDGSTSYSYSTDVWEAIKAAAAGDADAETVGWQDYVNDVLTRAQNAGLGNFTASVIYMVRVTEDAGKLILEYELHESATKDVILVAQVA
ncbi:MAG: hypothetical protein COT21_01085 [Hadesarchaea archaeon CG08_land_8_20_14_0_20_51_8]|nr:MAG: hypothetical protein COT21_01085 [Hadesarchaea archaeon CG08_land_8_20_14_0_20_51_8]